MFTAVIFLRDGDGDLDGDGGFDGDGFKSGKH